jgi:hypothetical protein
MRIWTLHPKYLDSKGLVALWRETLLAKHVLEGKTKGYKNHPQLNRFKAMEKPVDGINYYLSIVYFEAVKRNYNFNIQKINWDFNKQNLTVTSGQIDFEAKHLLKKLVERDLVIYNKYCNLNYFETHEMFTVVVGAIESWEII